MQVPHVDDAVADEAWAYAAFFDQSPIGLAIVDRHKRYRYINEALAEFNHIPREETLGRTVGEVLGHSAVASEIEALLARALDGESVSQVQENPLGDEPRQHYSVHYWPLRDDQRRVTGVAALVQRVTVEKEVAEALARSEAHYRLLVELSGQLVWSATPDGQVEFVNRSVLEYTGLPPGAAGRTAFYSVIHPEEVERVQAARAAALRGGLPYSDQMRLRHRSGEYRWFLVQAQPVRNSDGTVQRFIGVATDIHERHQLDEALDRYRLLSSFTRDIILFVREDGRVVEANEAACSAYGFRRAELLEKNIRDLRAPHTHGDIPQRNAAVWDSHGPGEVIFETEHLRADGTTFPVEVSAARADLGRESVAISVVRDITARRRAERERQEEERFRELFVGVLGHDLRTPLSAIVASADLMLERGGLDEQQQTTLKRIVASSGRMNALIAQVLDLTRARLAGGIPVERSPLRLGELLERVVEEQLLLDPAVRIRVAVSGDDGGHWDGHRLSQVFQNLVENALAHGDRQHPVHIEIHGQADQVLASVHNEGVAIAAAELPHLFDPFRQGPQRKRRAEGLGLGLYIARAIAHAHGGDIAVRSDEREGTTFLVRLPRRGRHSPGS